MDTKLITFLTLCRLMNYRKTAEELHLTQPAVTKQIQALEQQYGTKLFIYDGRRLNKTAKCCIMEEYCESLQYNYEELRKKLAADEAVFIRVGATKTIGDYVLGPRIIRHLSGSDNGLSLVVDNTEKLLHLLDKAELDFAVIEGNFSKRKYGYRLMQKEPFVGICHKGHPFASATVAIEAVFGETLIVRESGSGTRDILERELRNLGFDLASFKKTVYISSFKLIRELVAEKIGVSFAYQSVIGDDEGFATFTIEGFSHEHEFNAVYLKDTYAEKYAQMFLEF